MVALKAPCLLTKGAEQDKNEELDIRELLNMCRERRMWGSLKIMYQEGRIAHVEVTQTLKGVPQAIIIALELQK